MDAFEGFRWGNLGVGAAGGEAQGSGAAVVGGRESTMCWQGRFMPLDKSREQSSFFFITARN